MIQKKQEKDISKCVTNGVKNNMPTEIQTHWLYNGEIKIDFYPNSHRYKRDGKWLVSVTSALGMIAKPLLIPWAVNMATDFLLDKLQAGELITQGLIIEAKTKHREKKEEAAAIGSVVHEWAENYIKTGKRDLPKDNDPAMNGIVAFLKWVDEHKVEFISSERFVYSRRNDYAGIMDAEARINGKHCVIDFKTSKRLYPEMRFQTAAYQMAAEEEGTLFEGDRWIVRFDKETGEFEAHEHGDLEQDFAAFMSALTIKKRLKELK